MTSSCREACSTSAEDGGIEQRSYPTPVQQFALRLADLREERGLTLRELAELTGNVVTKSVISRIEKGKTPPSATAAKLLDQSLKAGGKLEVLGAPARAQPYIHLPPGPPYFIGRHAELAKLTTTARSHPPTSDAATVLLLSGPPGVGKTALALLWANTMQEMFDVVLYSALAGYAAEAPALPGEILSDLLRGLGVEPNVIPAAIPQRQSLLREQLRRREQRVLVVLDNARDSHHVQPLLADIVGTTVLVTSRSQLSGLVLDHDAHVVRVDTMEDADAVALAAEIIGDDSAVHEPDALAQLVDLCGSLPLAVLVAAERVAASPDTSIQDHVAALADLERRLLLLDIDEQDDSIGVRAAFRWSYETLPSGVARMFRLLSLHPGPQFSARAASALADLAPDEGELLLDHLAQAHLVDRIGTDYYRFHDLLRVYAADECARQSTRARHDAVARLVRWFLHSANAAAWALTPGRDHHVRLPPPPKQIAPLTFHNFTEAFAWCTQELPNFLPIARIGMQNELYFEVWRISVDHFDFFVHSRQLATWIDGFQIAIDAALGAADNNRLAEAQEKLAEGYRRQGDLDRARELDLDAIESGTHLGPSRTRGFALLGLGNNAYLNEHYHEALILTQQAISTFIAAGSWVGEATARTYLGSVFRALGDEDHAIEQGERALKMFTAARDRHGTAIALLPLARTCHQFDDLHRALLYCDQANAAYRATVDTSGQADAQSLKGLVLADLGDRDGAIACLRDALRLVEGHDERKAQQLLVDLAALTTD